MTGHNRRALLAVVLAMILALGVTPADAEESGFEILADGLDNPRGLVAASGGRVFVAEAGRGGDILVDTPLGDSAGPICIGLTGSITRINRNGRVREILTDLPSATDAINGACEGPSFGSAATGIHGIDSLPGRLSYSLGLGGTPEIRDLLADSLDEASDFGSVTELRGRRPSTVSLADFEAETDPDGQGVDSNPYGVLRERRGVTLATDAGGNSLVRMRRNDRVEVVATFTPRCVPWTLPFPNPLPTLFNPCGDPAFFPAQAVPTDVARHPDGDFLVTTLGGFPFAVGESLVYKVDADHDGPAVCSTLSPASGCEVFAGGLTALIGIDVDHDGNVYVVQFADGGILGAFSGAPGADAGSVQIFDSSGASIGSIDGLTLPGGISTDHDYAYVTNFSVFAGAGQVVRAPLPS